MCLKPVLNLPTTHLSLSVWRQAATTIAIDLICLNDLRGNRLSFEPSDTQHQHWYSAATPRNEQRASSLFFDGVGSCGWASHHTNDDMFDRLISRRGQCRAAVTLCSLTSALFRKRAGLSSRFTNYYASITATITTAPTVSFLNWVDESLLLFGSVSQKNVELSSRLGLHRRNPTAANYHHLLNGLNHKFFGQAGRLWFSDFVSNDRQSVSFPGLEPTGGLGSFDATAGWGTETTDTISHEYRILPPRRDSVDRLRYSQKESHIRGANPASP
jgi:hypothetical protein